MPDPATDAKSREIILKHDTQYWVMPDCRKPLFLETRGGRLTAGTKVVVGPARHMYTDGGVYAVPFTNEGRECFLLIQDLHMPELYPGTD